MSAIIMSDIDDDIAILRQDIAAIYWRLTPPPLCRSPPATSLRVATCHMFMLSPLRRDAAADAAMLLPRYAAAIAADADCRWLPLTLITR